MHDLLNAIVDVFYYSKFEKMCNKVGSIKKP